MKNTNTHRKDTGHVSVVIPNSPEKPVSFHTKKAIPDKIRAVIRDALLPNLFLRSYKQC